MILSTFKKACHFCGFIVSESANLAYYILFIIPLCHILGFLSRPTLINLFGVFVLGPLMGLYTFLSTPKSLAVGLAALTTSIACSFFFPLPLSYSFGIGLGFNLLTGLVQSRVTRYYNQKELEEQTKDLGKDEGQLAFYVRRDLVNSKFPDALGPLPKALHYNFKTANQLAPVGTRPFGKEELYWLPENMGGLAPRNNF